MRRIKGMTLIELMIVLAVVAILVSIALPSYQSYYRRGIRSQAQQFMMDMAQAQEQLFLDSRQYAQGFGVTVPGNPPLLNRAMPPSVSAFYTMGIGPGLEFILSAAGVQPQTFTILLTPIACGKMADACGGTTPGDGQLLLNSLQQRWREKQGGDQIFNAITDCTWEAATCVPQ